MRLHRRRISRRGGAALLAALSLLTLSGCEARRIVARVNSKTITGEELANRVERVHPAEIRNSGDQELGAITLANMVNEEMIRQLAAKKKSGLTQEQAERLADYEAHRPDISAEMTQGVLTHDDLVRNTITSYDLFSLATNGAKADPAAVQKRYDAVAKLDMSAGGLTIPEEFVIHVVTLPSEELAKQALDLLNRGQSFPEVAKQLVPRDAAEAGRETTLPVTSLQRSQPELYAALNGLQSGKVAQKPFPIQAMIQNQPIMRYIVVALVRKEPPYTPTLDQVRPQIEEMVLQETRPDWQQAAFRELLDGLKSADIEVNIDRYRDIVKTILEPQLQAASNPPQQQQFAPAPTQRPVAPRRAFPPPPSAAPGQR